MTWARFRRAPRAQGPGKAARSSQRGFALMETLIAFALVAMAAGTLAGLFAWNASTQKLRADRLLLAEFARSTLEEYSATYPLMAPEGEAPGGWHWAIAAEPVVPDQVERLQGQITYFALTVKVWNGAAPALQIEAETLLAVATP